MKSLEATVADLESKVKEAQHKAVWAVDHAKRLLSENMALKEQADKWRVRYETVASSVDLDEPVEGEAKTLAILQQKDNELQRLQAALEKARQSKGNRHSHNASVPASDSHAGSETGDVGSTGAAASARTSGRGPACGLTIAIPDSNHAMDSGSDGTPKSGDFTDNDSDDDIQVRRLRLVTLNTMLVKFSESLSP